MDTKGERERQTESAYVGRIDHAFLVHVYIHVGGHVTNIILMSLL